MTDAFTNEILNQTIRDSNGDIHFRRVQDVEDIIERNKRLAKEKQKSDWGRHIASIPNVILERWMKEEGVNYLALNGEEFGKLIKRKLADPDWQYLRTS